MGPSSPGPTLVMPEAPAPPPPPPNPPMFGSEAAGSAKQRKQVATNSGWGSTFVGGAGLNQAAATGIKNLLGM